MAMRQPRYTGEEYARRGTQIYEERIRPQVAEGNRGKFVAVDIETGEFELAVSSLDAINRLLTRLPDAQIWLLRIGYKAARHFSCPAEPEGP